MVQAFRQLLDMWPGIPVANNETHKVRSVQITHKMPNGPHEIINTILEANRLMKRSHDSPLGVLLGPIAGVVPYSTHRGFNGPLTYKLHIRFDKSIWNILQLGILLYFHQNNVSLYILKGSILKSNVNNHNETYYWSPQ